MIVYGVPALLFLSSVLMAFAWLGHLKFRSFGFWPSLLASWFLVLPEYMLNVLAIRSGHGTYSGAEMAAFNLCCSVLCVALVARFFLGEPIRRRQWAGFVLMIQAIVLVVYE